MSRYIDADGFFETFEELDKEPYTTYPASEVRENVRGEWLHISDGYCDFLKCSQCGKTTDRQSNYCPNCGCLMKGEET